MLRIKRNMTVIECETTANNNFDEYYLIVKQALIQTETSR